SDAVNPRFHCVLRPASCVRVPAPGIRRPASGAWRPAPGILRPGPNLAPTERNPLIRGKPFLTAGKHLTDYGELPTARASPERIEGVSRSLPYSDLLTLTSSHMFFSVMN